VSDARDVDADAERNLQEGILGEFADH
jgi:hypothetical protein